MNERVKFIARYLENEEAFAMLCEDAGISRKTNLPNWMRATNARFRGITVRTAAPLAGRPTVGPRPIGARPGVWYLFLAARSA